MTEMGLDDSRESVLAVFEDLADSTEPLTTNEVAERLQCSYRCAYVQLTELAERGEVRSKTIGPRARAWWRPGPTTESAAATDSTHDHLSRSMRTEDQQLVWRFLEAIPVSIVVVDRAGEIVAANERATEMLDLEPARAPDRTYREPDWELYYDDGTRITIDEHPVTRVLESGEPEFGFEHWIAFGDGTERWLSTNSAPVLDDDGTVEYVVIGFEDATPLKEREDKLTSERRRWVELHSERLFGPFLEAADGPVCIDVDEVVSRPDETTLQYLSATGIDARSLVGVLERVPGVLGVRLLRSTPEHCRVEVHQESQTLSRVFDDLGGRVTCLVRTGTDGSPVLIGELPGDVDVRTVIRNARRIYPDVELVAQGLRYTPRLLYDIVEDALTDRQFAALQAAYFGGYFDTPRGSTGDELAGQLGVTRQTFNQHLRKAERTLIEQLFEASGKAAR